MGKKYRNVMVPIVSGTITFSDDKNLVGIIRAISISGYVSGAYKFGTSGTEAGGFQITDLTPVVAGSGWVQQGVSGTSGTVLGYTYVSHNGTGSGVATGSNACFLIEVY